MVLSLQQARNIWRVPDHGEMSRMKLSDELQHFLLLCHRPPQAAAANLLDHDFIAVSSIPAGALFFFVRARL